MATVHIPQCFVNLFQYFETANHNVQLVHECNQFGVVCSYSTQYSQLVLKLLVFEHTKGWPANAQNTTGSHQVYSARIFVGVRTPVITCVQVLSKLINVLSNDRLSKNIRLDSVMALHSLVQGHTSIVFVLSFDFLLLAF